MTIVRWVTSFRLDGSLGSMIWDGQLEAWDDRQIAVNALHPWCIIMTRENQGGCEGRIVVFAVKPMKNFSTSKKSIFCQKMIDAMSTIRCRLLLRCFLCNAVLLAIYNLVLQWTHHESSWKRHFAIYVWKASFCNCLTKTWQWFLRDFYIQLSMLTNSINGFLSGSLRVPWCNQVDRCRVGYSPGRRGLTAIRPKKNSCI